MNSKLMRIMAVGLTTLFLSAQAFAGADKDVGDKTDRNLSSTYDRSGSGQPTDRDKNKIDKSSKDASKSKDLDQSQDSLFDVFPPMPY